MDLVTGDAREILPAIGVDDWAGLRDPARFAAYISLGSGLDPTWLDLFARRRETTGHAAPDRSARAHIGWRAGWPPSRIEPSSASTPTGSTRWRSCRRASWTASPRAGSI
jgi:hypothetical protein